MSVWLSSSNFGVGGAYAQISGGNTRAQVFFETLLDNIDNLTQIAQSKINILKTKASAMSISDMFDMQMAMNKLSQFSEMSTSVISAMNTAIGSMARSVKG